jgi:hypothetical protein
MKQRMEGVKPGPFGGMLGGPSWSGQWGVVWWGLRAGDGPPASGRIEGFTEGESRDG